MTGFARKCMEKYARGIRTAIPRERERVLCLHACDEEIQRQPGAINSILIELFADRITCCPVRTFIAK